jgi:hypothetical protein
LAKLWVAIAPASALAKGTTEPTLTNYDWTATPTASVSGSRATMEKVDGRGSMSEASEATPKSVRPAASVSGFTSRRVLLGGEGLALGAVAVEGRMLGEVVDQHVPPSAGQPRLLHVLGGERLGQAVVESPEDREVLEHFPVARRVGSSARDDVTAVLAVGADRPHELSALGQRVAQRRAQLVGLGSGEFVGLARDGYDDRLAGVTRFTGFRRRRLFGTEFLDQPPTGDLLYPRRPRK